MHSVRIELAKLVLVGTRITDQTTGDAGSINTLQVLQDTASRCKE